MKGGLWESQAPGGHGAHLGCRVLLRGVWKVPHPEAEDPQAGGVPEGQ